MKKLFYPILIILFCSKFSLAQNVTINPTGITPLPAATGYPRISNAQILALPSPLKGDLAYDLTFNCLRVFNGTKWLNILTGQDTNQPATLAWTVSSAGSSVVNKIEKDASGNIYALGNFSQTATFSSTSITSVGDNDIFLAKYTDTGTLLWVKSAGSPAGDIGLDLKIDASGNPIITGYYNDAINFNGIILSNLGGSDICIAKYNSSGTLVWAKKAGGAGLDIPSNLETDPSGNIYLSSNFLGTITFFGTSNTVLMSAGLKDGALAKYDSNGSLLWAKGLSSSTDNTVGDLEIVGSNLYLVGNYSGTVNLGNSVSLSSSISPTDNFIARYDLNGNCQNAINLGSSTLTISKIVKDANSNLYICGSSYGATSIGGLSLSGPALTYSIFAKLNSSLAVTLVIGLPCPSLSGATSIDIDATGNIYLVGFFNDSISNYIQTLTSKGLSDVFLAKFNPSGIPLLLLNFGSLAYDSSTSMVLGSNIFISGLFNGDFGNSLYNPGANPNAFILRVSE
jgi:hypothetical protein